jgi:hypothetical protein
LLLLGVVLALLFLACPGVVSAVTSLLLLLLEPPLLLLLQGLWFVIL